MSEQNNKGEQEKKTADKKGKADERGVVEKYRALIGEKAVEFRAEFRKIVWPSREELMKHTVTTIVISLLFGAYIALLDGGFGIIYTTLVGLLGQAGAAS